MSAKSHGSSSSKKNKQKSRQSASVAHNSTSSVFTGQSQASGSSSFQSSTSFSSLQRRHGNTSSSSTLDQDAPGSLPGLDDLDFDEPGLGQTKPLSKKQRQQTPQQLLKAQADMTRSDFWSWITSSRVVPGQSPQQTETHSNKFLWKEDATEAEKKLVRHSWDMARSTQSSILTPRDWIALSAITVATIGVRFWRISWPDEVV